MFGAHRPPIRDLSRRPEGVAMYLDCLFSPTKSDSLIKETTTSYNLCLVESTDIGMYSST